MSNTMDGQVQVSIYTFIQIRVGSLNDSNSSKIFCTWLRMKYSQGLKPLQFHCMSNIINMSGVYCCSSVILLIICVFTRFLLRLLHFFQCLVCCFQFQFLVLLSSLILAATVSLLYTDRWCAVTA